VGVQDAAPLAVAGPEAHDGAVRKLLLLAGSTIVLVVLLAASLRLLGAGSVWFAFLVVWLPMAWLGTVSRLVTPRLWPGWHTLRPFERDGRVYALLGVRVVKGLLRRGPLAVFNPDLHLPTETTPERLGHLEQRMCDAEATHVILFVAMLGVVALEIAAGNRAAAVWIVVFDVMVNGYPVMLQRYNRALLHQRYDDLFA